MQKVIFYPGQKIITEGRKKDMNKLYIIVEGECNLVCVKNSRKFDNLENKDDPCKFKRDIERNYRINPLKKQT